MQESKIENELVEVTKFKPKKNEERQAYLQRLMKAVSNPKMVTDEIWEGLTKGAQDWTNGAAEEYKGGRAVADFDDYEEVEEPEDEEVDEEKEEVKPKAKPVAKKEEKKVTAAASPTRKVSACHMIKKIVVQDPKITVADLSAQLKENGLKVSDVTISTLRSDLRDTLRVMNELKMGDFIL